MSNINVLNKKHLSEVTNKNATHFIAITVLIEPTHRTKLINICHKLHLGSHILM